MLFGFDFIFPLAIEFFCLGELYFKEKSPLFHFFGGIWNQERGHAKLSPGKKYFTATFLFDISNMIFIFVYYPYGENATFNLPYKQGVRHISGANLSKKADLPIQMVHSLTAKNNWSKLSISKKLRHSKFVFFKTLEGYDAFSGKQSENKTDFLTFPACF